LAHAISAHEETGYDQGALEQILAVVLDKECMQKLSHGLLGYTEDVRVPPTVVNELAI
jgi:hypothetical protein